MSDPIRRLESRTVVLPTENIDTDQIIPARFLMTTTREGRGKELFADWRYDATGAPRPEFVLNRPESEGAAILVTGRNFGCGSSREHAVWALRDHGFRAVISSELADIFQRNAQKNGIVPVVLDRAAHETLLAQPGARVVVDLEAQTVTLPDGSLARFPIAPFARYCLLEGVDELSFLASQDAAITAYERRIGG
jgi:3-isopropylmalate/(R)-2-methylmalate dehydratase small subunit